MPILLSECPSDWIKDPIKDRGEYVCMGVHQDTTIGGTQRELRLCIIFDSMMHSYPF